MRRAQRRAQVIRSATHVFAKDGYYSTSMDAIAAHIGVSKPVLYQHFDSKLDLFLTVLDEAIIALDKTLGALLDSVQDRQERVYSTIKSFFMFAVENRAAFDILMRADTENDESRAHWHEALDTFAATVSRSIYRDTNVTEEESDILGHALVGMAKQAAYEWSRNRQYSPQESARLVGMLAYEGLSAITEPQVDLFADGIGGRGSEVSPETTS